MAFRNWLAAGAAALMLSGDNLPPPYTGKMLQKIDSTLEHSWMYGNNLKGEIIYLNEWNIVGERYFDDMKYSDGKHNSVYLIHELGTPYFAVRIFHDVNENDRVDDDELAFGMMNYDWNIADAESIGMMWKGGILGQDDFIMRLKRDDKELGNRKRFMKVDQFFRKIVHQTRFYEYARGQ